MAAVALALCASLSWGVGDFLGGITSRRLGVLPVLALSQLAGLAGLALWVGVAGESLPDALRLLAAGGAGVAGVAALACLYRGLAIGAMGIVAPISATAPVVALAFDLARGEAPSGRQAAGFAVALAGVALASREPVPGGARLAAGVGLALVAALGFGLFFVGLDTAAEQSVPWAVAIARAVSTVLALAVAARMGASLRVGPRLLPAVLAVGVADAGANVLFALATTRGLLSVVAVLSALYPVVTVLLARLLLGERTGATQRLGAFAALAGAALIASG